MTRCGCGANWTGLNICHCATCHETFTGITGFDKHRIGKWHPYDASKDTRRCAVSPADVGLVPNARGQWGSGRNNEQWEPDEPDD